ncbi:Aspartyl-tRNA synthetase @ Aspartyl-tRNA(Asn) synthetase [Olavius algarvensis spirochete endosymbiont]|uniref:aspartate--tRNA(Asn) ligase n=1 Tax=Olavius algarvensis spirochete endosymbiont TaxID=260710 RepID=UPI000F14CA4B|nr:aspartate--tRNA(Asn) ligase [Olavius algarvensis spirochete endosymbiont]VDA99187.1 Aspartyl-tRNA synthetase @ Aspartyl-tRNA(Asn) synthetase [Olavius algarvensis spirochete endosymbiont]
MERILCAEALKRSGITVEVAGWVHRVRNLGGIVFIILRDRSGFIQLVRDSEFNLNLESVIRARGKLSDNAKAPGGREILLQEYEVLSEAEQNLPIAVNQDPEVLGLETILDNRMISVRNPKLLSIFRVQATCIRAFGDFFRGEDFTEIKSSKIIGGGSEGGTNLFSMDYFGRTAYLAQSPQLYKQTMVASGLERVFEIGHAYRAEKHETPRHINEYVSLDVEMGFIDSEKPLMEIERDFMAYLFEVIARENQSDLSAWNATLPNPDSCAKIPIITYEEAKGIVKKGSGTRVIDINPEAERILCDWADREMGIPMIFINEFPRRKRPFYTYPIGQKTMSFDLLFRGLEITTGGRRINDYSMLKEALPKFGMVESELGSYVDIFRYGCPPHGGFAIGLERITQKILSLANVKEATLFPRDRKRISP